MTNNAFWNISSELHSRTALIDAATGERITYGDLDRAVEKTASTFASRSKLLIFLFCSNRPADIIAYLAALRARHAVLLLDAKLDEKLRRNLVTTYAPELIIDSGPGSEYEGYERGPKEGSHTLGRRISCEAKDPLYDELGLLLSTSGTTGSPKLVRLAYRNIQANACSIAEYLSIGEGETAITSLPMSYSYGLSVINSHLLKGAALVCTGDTMAQRQFWDSFRKYSCTSFAGVPYNYQLLIKLGFKNMSLPSLRIMTQAGGRLSEEFKKYFLEYARARNLRFFVMYGQTEATARISYVPPACLGDKLNSIGIPIPGGKLSLSKEGLKVEETRTEGELVYEGPNVMLGYAESRSCLCKGDELKGLLSTGDVAYRDAEGYYYITGRLKRFLKVFGLRLNLDDIEKVLENEFGCVIACTGNDDNLVILIEHSQENIGDQLRRRIAEVYKIHISAIRVFVVPMIPVTSSGKKDYAKVKEFSL